MSDARGNGLILEQIEESINFNDVQLHLVSEENIHPPKHNYCINRIIKVKIGTIKYIRDHSFIFRN